MTNILKDIEEMFDKEFNPKPNDSIAVNRYLNSIKSFITTTVYKMIVEDILKLIPEETTQIKYISAENKEFAKQLRELLTKRLSHLQGEKK